MDLHQGPYDTQGNVARTRDRTAHFPGRVRWLGTPSERRFWRDLLFRTGSTVADALGVLNLLELLGSRETGCLFTLHRVARPGEWAAMPDRSFYCDVDCLDKILHYLKSSGWEFLTMSEVTERLSGKTLGGRFVNFSVDDVYRDTYELAVPLFQRHKVPLTLYVTTGIPDGSCVLWWAGLNTILRNCTSVYVPWTAGELRVQIDTSYKKRRLFSLLHSAWEKRAITAYKAFCSANGYDLEELHWLNAAQWTMLDSLRGDPWVEIAAHTISHPRLSRLPENEAIAEITGSRSRIQERLGVPVYHFAFPHGDSSACGPREYELVRQCGFASAVTTHKGVLQPGRDIDAFALPRVTLQGEQRRISAIKAHITGLSALIAPRN